MFGRCYGARGKVRVLRLNPRRKLEAECIGVWPSRVNEIEDFIMYEFSFVFGLTNCVLIFACVTPIRLARRPAGLDIYNLELCIDVTYRDAPRRNIIRRVVGIFGGKR